MDGDSYHCTGGGDQNHPQEKEVQEGKVVVWGGLTNSLEEKWEAKEKGEDTLNWMQRVPWTVRRSNQSILQEINLDD